MEFSSGAKIAAPLLLPDVVRINESEGGLAQSYAATLRKVHLEGGEYLEALKHTGITSLEKLRIEIELPKPSSKFLYPEMSLEFDSFIAELPTGNLIGFVPVLGIDAVGKNREKVLKHLSESIHLEFARRKRLKDVRSIINVLWFNNVEAKPYQQVLPFYTFAELDEIRAGKKKRLIPSIADDLDDEIPFRGKPAAYHMENEVDQLTKALTGRFVRSVLLVGPSGSGKSALVEEFNRLKSEKDLREGTIWRTTAAGILQGLTGETGWQEGLSKVCRELRDHGDILYVKNLADLFEVGRYEGNEISLAQFIEEYVSRGEVVLVSECTEAESATLETRFPGYLSMFRMIRVPEPPPEKCLKIVRAKIGDIARLENVKVEDAAVKEITRLQRRFTPYSGFPGKTIRFLESILLGGKQDRRLLDRKTVIGQFCEETGIPSFMIDPNLPLDPATVREFFTSNIFGQQEAVETVVDLIITVKTALMREGKPLATLMFAGPTGVGKTEMAKVLAQFMFGNRDRMTRFDMSEFSDPRSVFRLTGDLSGGEGLLTTEIRQNPFSVILFDELEKAHYSFFDLLLQILGEGRLTDRHGKTADFNSYIIVMTSNIGSRSFQSIPAGFTGQTIQRVDAIEHFRHEVEQYFRPELFNRLDRLIAFAPLDRDTIRKIVDRELGLIRKREGFKFRKLQLEINDATLGVLAELGYDPGYGARQMQRTLREKLIVPMARQLNRFGPTDTLYAEASQVEGDKIKVDVAIQEKKRPRKGGAGDPTAEQRTAADRITFYRRKYITLENSSCYLKVVSELDILERKKKKQKHKFWEKPARTERYGTCSRILEKCRGLSKEIKESEITASLPLLMEKTLPPGVSARFESWKSEFHMMERDLYSAAVPKADSLVVGIYGPNKMLIDLAEIYMESVRALGLEVSEKQSVWHMGAGKKYKSRAYACGADIRKRNETPGKLIGVEIQVTGSCAMLYFRREGGMQSWLPDPDNKYLFFFNVENRLLDRYRTKKKDHAPPGVHRRQFYTRLKLRRTYSGSEDLNDTTYSYDRSGEPISALIADALKKEFAANLESSLYGR